MEPAKTIRLYKQEVLEYINDNQDTLEVVNSILKYRLNIKNSLYGFEKDILNRQKYPFWLKTYDGEWYIMYLPYFREQPEYNGVFLFQKVDIILDYLKMNFKKKKYSLKNYYTAMTNTAYMLPSDDNNIYYIFNLNYHFINRFREEKRSKYLKDKNIMDLEL